VRLPRALLRRSRGGRARPSINNTSAENLATLLGRELLQRLRVRYPIVAVRGLSLAVEETAGQRGVYHFTPE